MSGKYERIKEEARQLGACALVGEINDAKTFATVLFSPQGREFCIHNNYPVAESFTTMQKRELSRHGIFVSAGDVDAAGIHDVCAIGNTKVAMNAFGTEALYHILLLDGAKAEITVGGYSVVNIESSATSRVEIIHTDNTSRVICHAQEN